METFMQDAAHQELRSRLLWQRAPALTGAFYLALIERAGSAAAALEAGPSLWHEVGLTPRTQHWLTTAQHLDLTRDLAWLNAPEHALLMIDDPRYPPLLRHCADAPLGLFVAGNLDTLQLPQLAVVGSRNPTPYGREAAHAFAKHLTHCGLSIASGLAAGIDAASHEGALSGGGHTVAVCGTGLDVIYPRSSAPLAARVLASGALVSEYPPGTPVRKHHFPARNRIISGLSLGTLVVEAALHSGSLITARLATEQGREVFALPGSIHSPLSKGCHLLIRQGAKLVDSVADILCELGPLAQVHGLSAATPPDLMPNPENPIDFAGNSLSRLDKDSEILLDALGFDAAGVDQLVARSGLKAEAVASLLLMLELDGRVTSAAGGTYQRRLD